MLNVPPLPGVAATDQKISTKPASPLAAGFRRNPGCAWALAALAVLIAWAVIAGAHHSSTRPDPPASPNESATVVCQQDVEKIRSDVDEAAFVEKASVSDEGDDAYSVDGIFTIDGVDHEYHCEVTHEPARGQWFAQATLS